VPLSGVQAAAITPRTKDGDIDLGASFELLDHLCRAGVQGVVLFADAADCLAFTPAERSRLVYLAVKRSRVPILAGVGSPTLDLAVTLAREAAQAGADGLVISPPVAQCLEPDDIAEFYLCVAQHLGRGVPVYLRERGVPVETALRVLETGLFAGIAVDREDFSAFPHRDHSFERIALTDARFAEARREGLAVISAAACAVPELFVGLDAALAAGDSAKAGRLEGALKEFVEWVRGLPPGVVVKTATAARGLKTGPLALPLSPRRQKALEEFRQWFQGWLPGLGKLCAHA